LFALMKRPIGNLTWFSVISKTFQLINLVCHT